MPSTNKTPNLGLDQWAGNEYPKRADFNSDFAAIDAAHPGTNTKAEPIAADSVLLYDSADAAKPKKTLLSALTTFFKTTLADTFAALVHTHKWVDITDPPGSYTPSVHTHAAGDITSGVLLVARGGTGAGDAAGARSSLGAATAPTSVTATLPASGWTLNSSTTCYEQTVPVTGLLASDSTKTVTVWPHGSTDAAAQLLTDAAYAAIFTQGGYAACNQDGNLYCRGPAGGSKPQVDFPVDVVFHR